MKRIETKRPFVLGKPSRKFNPKDGVANFTPLIESEIISKAEVRGAMDSFPYLRDVVMVLFALYGEGRMSEKLGRDLPSMIAAWAAREDPPRSGRSNKKLIVKRNFKLRRDTYEKALQRWRAEAPEAAQTATAMFAFLLELYGDGEIELALRRGKDDE